MKKLLLLTITALFIAQTSCSLTDRLETAQTEITTARTNDNEAHDTCTGSCNGNCSHSTK